MRAPSPTYVFTSPTDTAGPTFEPLSRAFQIGGAFLLIEALLIDIPKDRVLVFTNATVQALPGATQTVTEIKIQIVTQTGLVVDVATSSGSQTADVIENLNWSGSYYVAGGGAGNRTLRLIASFDANANANTLTAGIHGIIVPRGNIGAF